MNASLKSNFLFSSRQNIRQTKFEFKRSSFILNLNYFSWNQNKSEKRILKSWQSRDFTWKCIRVESYFWTSFMKSMLIWYWTSSIWSIIPWNHFCTVLSKRTVEIYSHIFLAKNFRENNVFTKEITKELIWRNIFCSLWMLFFCTMRIRNFCTFHGFYKTFSSKQLL